MNIKISFELAPQYGDMAPMRDRWMQAEAMGADRLFTCDHFHAMVVTAETLQGVHADVPVYGKNFEATTIQAAMAATTTRPEIGCIVHGNSYRNPNLMADIARTIDHISGGRFILGMGSGYLKPDYDEYGYEYGTQKSRLEDLARDLPIIKSRYDKLTPPPLRRIPMLIGSSGDKIGLRLVAEHADIWHVYGSREHIAHKIRVLEQHCADIGRDPREIEYMTYYMPGQIPDADLDAYLQMGIRSFCAVSFGPEWDLGVLRELLEWRKGLAN